jgi:outer membrane protein OmpA-like peptidoglycan-associated protein
MWRVKNIAVLLIALAAAAPAFAAEAPRGPVYGQVKPAGPAKPIGQIKKVSGTVTVVRGQDQLRAKPGVPVYQGDVIRTGPDGGIGITFNDNSLFSAGPSSELALPQFDFDAGTDRGNMLAAMRKGTLTVVSGDITHTTPGAMSIRTPTAILGVRGTTFAVEVVVVGLCQCVSDYSAPHMRCVPSAHYCQMICATTHYSFVPATSTELAACPQQEQFPQERYVVLPNADGRPGSGAITVNYNGNATTLDQPYATAEVRDGRTTARAMKPAEAQSIFQEAFAARPALPAHFRLNFELDRSQMTAASLPVYRTLVGEIKKRQAYQVEVVGYTDTLASEAHNKQLSWDRAVAVRTSLVRDGADAQAINIDGRGDTDPVVRSPPGIGEPRNRRVEITVR